MNLLPPLLSLLMLLVIYFDGRHYIIPNWLVGLVLALYPLAVWLSPEAINWPMALAAGAIMFVAGFIMFTLRWMGGGDVKLLAACALWVGMGKLLEYSLWVAIFGGALSLFLLMMRPVLHWTVPAWTERLPKLFHQGAPVPYGLAIAIAFLLLLWQGAVPGLPL